MADPQATTDLEFATDRDGQPAVRPTVDDARPGVALTTDLPVVRAGGTRASAGDDAFRGMLRLRVTVVMSLATAIWGTILLLGATGADPLYSRAVIGGGGLALIAVMVFSWAAGAVAFWSVRRWPVRALRVGEFFILVPHAGLLIACRVLQFSASPHSVPGREGDFFQAATGHNGFGWLAALVAWGLVFPHPWRRMLAINAALCVLPLATDLGLILARPERLPAHSLYVAVTAEMLLFGFVVSLFGSQRITALQAEVAEARQQAREARRLGPYTLKKRLGVGGMGEVYLAEHHLLKRPCAVKLIRPERAGDQTALARFEREAQATARLKHPNTVAVLDYGRTEDGTFYYVMELLDGLSLEEVVRRHGPLPASRALRVLTQLCGPLREAHGAGLIHRDVKPSNVLLCRHGGLFDVVKLVDFGLVAGDGAGEAGAALTRDGSVIGTPDYVSPEQADGTGADERSDLYSLGATAYFILTGRPPFAGRTVLDVLFAHRTHPVPSVQSQATGVPADLDALVGRLMAKSPADRPPSAAATLISLVEIRAVPPWTDADAEQWWGSVADRGVTNPAEGAGSPQALQPTGVA